MKLSFPSLGQPARQTRGAGATLVLLGLVLISPLAARAQGTDKNAPAKTSDKEYVLTHKSSYTSPPTTRSPFWPIGWMPSAVVAPTAVVAAPLVRAEDFVVTSISLDYPPLAVINKRTYGVGDRIPVGAAGKDGPYVTVRQITDGAVLLDFRGKLLRSGTNVPARSGGSPVSGAPLALGQ